MIFRTIITFARRQFHAQFLHNSESHIRCIIVNHTEYYEL